MKMEIFKSDRYFTVFDVKISHGQLLLRSQKDDSNEMNLDVVFWGTKYIQTFIGFNGICISKLDKHHNLIDYKTANDFLDFRTNYLFEINSNNENYYIGASFVKIFENKLEFNESSLLFVHNKGIEIAASLPS
jgi:hypothetical protein